MKSKRGHGYLIKQFFKEHYEEFVADYEKTFKTKWKGSKTKASKSLMHVVLPTLRTSYMFVSKYRGIVNFGTYFRLYQDIKDWMYRKYIAPDEEE